MPIKIPFWLMTIIHYAAYGSMVAMLLSKIFWIDVDWWWIAMPVVTYVLIQLILAVLHMAEIVDCTWVSRN